MRYVRNMCLQRVYLSPGDGGHPETLPQCLLVHVKTAEANPSRLAFRATVIFVLIRDLRTNVPLLQKRVHACQQLELCNSIQNVCGKWFVPSQKWSGGSISC